MRNRLVEQEQFRLADNRAANRRALLLTAGKLHRLALQKMFDLEHLCRKGNPLLDQILAATPQTKRVRHVLVNRLVRIERIIFEHHRDITILRLEFIHPHIAKMDISCRNMFKPGQHAQGR